ncbi:MAG: hypothetical protein SPL08_03195, partial [Pseudomonadota bacterium]|nr:hypothetical protein [Pseudomonadota bacterium]
AKSGATLKATTFTAPSGWSLASFVQTHAYLGRAFDGDNTKDADATYDEVRIWNGVLTEAQLSANAVVNALHFAKDRLDRHHIHNNAEAEGQILEEIVALTPDAEKFLIDAAQKMMLSGRGYHRILRVARTIADLESSARVETPHVAEALAFHRSSRFKKD